MIITDGYINGFKVYTESDIKRIEQLEADETNFKFGKNNIPRIVDGNQYLRFVEMIKKMDKVGYLEVDITDNKILDNIRIPDKLYKFCEETHMPLENAINTILRDFIIRYYSGNNVYENGILNRINKIPDKEISKDIKMKLLRHLLNLKLSK